MLLVLLCQSDFSPPVGAALDNWGILPELERLVLAILAGLTKKKPALFLVVGPYYPTISRFQGRYPAFQKALFGAENMVVLVFLVGSFLFASCHTSWFALRQPLLSITPVPKEAPSQKG